MTDIEKIIASFSEKLDLVTQKLDSMEKKKEADKSDKISPQEEYITQKLDSVPLPQEWKENMSIDAKILALRIHEELSKTTSQKLDSKGGLVKTNPTSEKITDNTIDHGIFDIQIVGEGDY